jgi:RHS repeat-associated protein
MRHPHFCIKAVANSGVVLSGRALMSMVENTERKGAPPAAASQTFSYDAFGNIDKSGSPYNFLPSYSSVTNHMTQIAGSTPSYDSDGNVTNDFLHTYSWDVYGRPTTIDGVGVTYDALGRIAEQNRSGAYTQVEYSPTGFKMQLISGQGYIGFVPLPGGAVAVWAGPPPYYRHPDWLGNSRFTSTSSRTMYYDGAYAPFGEPYAQTGTSDLSFTGMNQDTVPALYDFPSREYGIQGRWPSPDPAGVSAVSPGDPQTWNRYAYVRNNPLTMTDPTGLDGLDYYQCLGWGGCGAMLMNGGLYGPGAGFGGLTSLDLLQLATTPTQVLVNWQVIGATNDGQIVVGGCKGDPDCLTNNEVPIYDTVYPNWGLLNLPRAANNGYMVVNGNYVFPSNIDNKYNLMEKGKSNFRDLNPLCSTHVTVDQTTGQTQSHVDLFNPSVPLPAYYPVDVSGASIPLHLVLDAIPDAIYRATGMYLIPAGRTACQ